jgi:hypothetical protein
LLFIYYVNVDKNSRRCGESARIAIGGASLPPFLLKYPTAGRDAFRAAGTGASRVGSYFI